MTENIKLITINSADRQSGVASSFQFKLEKDLIAKKISLAMTSIPATFYNITTAISLNVGLGMLVVPPGNYNINDLVTTLSTLLVAIDPNFTCTYNTITMRVAIGCNVNFNLPFASSVGGSVLAKLLGFATQDYTGQSTYTAPNVPDVYWSEMRVLIPEVGILGVGATINSRYTFIVPNTTTKGNFALYKEYTDFNQVTYRDSMILSSINVQLKWPDGSLIDLGGADWSLTLHIIQ